MRKCLWGMRGAAAMTLALTVALGVLLFVPGVSQSRAALRAGAAVADITPPVGTPMFAYTARSRIGDPTDPEAALQIVADPDPNLYAKTFEPSRGIHTRVRASAIVLKRGDRKFALVQSDLGGLPYALFQDVLRRIRGTGITAARLLISATHTHSSTGPIWPVDSTGYAILGGDVFDPRIFELTAQGVASAILQANAKLEPARLGTATVPVQGASRNRDIDPFFRNGDVPADEVAARAISVNPDLTVLRVDTADGDPIGVWSNFAIHGTSFGDENLLFSGDNMASTERLVERRIPGVVDVWSNSAEGDVSPNGGPDVPDGDPLQYVPNSFASANLAGARVGEATVQAWDAAGAGMGDTFPIRARRTLFAFDGTSAGGEPVGPLEVLGAGGIVLDDGFCAPVDNLGGPGQGMKFPLVAGVGLVPGVASVSLWRIGGLGIAAFPSEITTQMGRRITGAIRNRAGRRLDRTVIAGLTNGYMSYTATPEEYDACHYEGSFTLFGRHQGQRFQNVALTLVAPLFTGSALPAGAPEPPPLGFGLPPLPPLYPTPDAGSVVSQPAEAPSRYERATFSWKGGDPSVDAPQGKAFVELQHRVGGDWQTVGTEDGPEDITVWDKSASIWNETWQFGSCDPLGTYRFRVHGMSSPALLASAEPYAVTSRSFELGPTAPLEVLDASVSGTTARARVVYPDPGPDALLALPRRVRDGAASFTVDLPGGGQSVVPAAVDADRLAFVATVPAGATIAQVDAHDACGNATG